MSLRPPSNAPGAPVSEVLFDALGHEILSEKAAALGRAGANAQACLDRLRAHAEEARAAPESADENEARRKQLLAAAAETVHAFFIQRELCGFRRHDSVIRDLQIPRQVLARLGAR